MEKYTQKNNRRNEKTRNEKKERKRPLSQIDAVYNRQTGLPSFEGVVEWQWAKKDKDIKDVHRPFFLFLFG